MAATLPPPIVVTGPTVVIGDAQFGGANGGWPGGQAPLGGTFVVGPNGDVIVGDGYGGNSSSGVFLITPAGVQSVLANFGNSDAAGMDKYGNAYIARDYASVFIKLPYNAATGTYTGFTTLPTTNCLGGTQDTAACVFAPGTQAVINAGKTAGGGNPGFSSLLFDGQGNFFFATDTNPGTGAGGNPNTIYECSAQCQAETDGAGTYPPVVVYADASGGLGSVAVDPWGNLFFSDGADNGANTGKVSYLQELPFTAGHYAATPTQITSYTTTAAYNALTGVSASNLNTVFFSVANDGVFALPNSSSGPNPAGIYKVSGQGGQGIAVDSIGNLYTVGYVGSLSHGGITKTPLNNLAFGASAVGTAATAVTATAIDNAGNCTTPPTLTFKDSESGVSTTEFATVAGTTCSTTVGTGSGTFSPALASTGASYSATITFTPTAVGARNAALVIADSTNSASGTTALTGVGNGPTGNVDPGVSTAFSTGFTSPASVVADPAGDVFVADSGAGKVYEIAHGTTTLTPVGTGFTAPDGLAFDANGDLFIADDGGPDVVEIPNTGTTAAFTAGTQLTVVSSTAPIGGTALSSATGLAVGPNGTLFISDTANKRVIFWNPLTGQSGVTLANTANGVKAPVGLAVDSSSNLYVADSTLDQVLAFWSAGGITAITPPNVTSAVGVAVDASGSVLVADAVSGNIVRIPDLAGTLTTASAITVETVPSQASSLSMDWQGNIYAASASGKAAYAIQRTAAAINFGTVSDGVSNSGTVYLMSAGNSAATLGTPDVTEPTNTMFTLVPAASNGCASGSAGPPGSSCQFTATFAPPPATPNGPQTGVATINIATPAVTFNVNMSGTATTSSILPQTITGFAPPASIQVGQQITLSATGGASGNPVTFSIDASSACPTCATIAGSVLTAVSTGVIKVDANQAGGTAGGKQYAAATQVQASITVQYTVVASDVPALLMSQIYWSYQSGSFTDGQNPAGGSFAVTQNGLIYVGTTYSNKTDIVSQSTGALVQQIAMNGGGVFTIDSNNNLYMGHLYNSAVYKIPYVSGAYVALSDLASAPNCTGTDTAICTVGSIPSGGMKAIAFDASGNLYMVTVPASPGTSAIYECAAACQKGGTATLVYSDVNAVSQVAFDPWGNMFFTDGVYASSANFGNDEVNTSNLYELKYTAGTGFAATPTLLQTLTDTTPASYDNQLDGVAVTSTGTIYYADQNDGMFAIPNTQTGGPDTAHQYVVSALGAKGMELDANGNEWVVVYHSGGDNLGEALIGDLTTPNAQYDGAPVNAAATVVDNALPCTTAATLAIASSNTEFGATAGTTCSTISANLTTAVSASSYPATITFTATKPNSQTATLTVTDTTNGGEGTATVTGFALTTPQALTFTAPTTITATYAPGLTIAVSVSNGGSNNPAVFTVDSSSSGKGTFSATTVTGKTSSATLTVTQAGSIVIDANELGGLAGGVYYDAAPQVQLTLTINKSPQAITFAQPTSPQAYTPGLTVNLSALGGGAATPVVFSVDASSTGAGTITTTTVTGNTSTATLTVTQAGTIVLDANQATDVDYLAAPQVQQVLVVNLAAQTITFTPVTVPFHYIASCAVITQCATISIQATGGATNNLIAISPDAAKNNVSFTILSQSVSKTGVTTTTIALLPNQTLASPANLVLDGNQQGNANYAAATQATLTIPVLAPLPLQSITWANPGTQVGATSLTLTGIASSGFPVTYTSGTSTVCSVSGAKVTFASVTSASPCTITATQPGDNLTFAAAVPLTQTLAVNPAGQNPNMSINLSLSSLTIQRGTVGLTQVTLTSVNNFAVSSIAFSCSGLPTGYICSFNPNPTTAFAQNTSTGMPLGTTVTTTLTITPPSTAAVVRQDFRPLFPATLAVALCFLGFKKRNRLYMLVLLVVLFAGLGFVSGCGGTSSSSTPPPVTSTATITATPAAGLAGASGSIQSSATLSVTLE
jgi:sugar lactone lactonase YvrE